MSADTPHPKAGLTDVRPLKLMMRRLIPETGERRRVLIVDDEPGMRYMARRVLESRFEVEEAASGDEALRLIESQEPFHFAIVDICLPGISGLELLTAMKTCCEWIDVIVMTGSVSDPDEALEDAVRRRAFFFLRKPFPMSILETLADRVVETQELEEEVLRHVSRLEKNLESARIFQNRLLPPTSYTGDRIRIASRYVASERLSGDFIDYWALPNGGTALFVADIMGHGPSSAMVTGMVKSMVHSLCHELEDPGEILTALETELSRIGRMPFLTAALLIDRPDPGHLTYCGAGHPAPFLLSPPNPGGRTTYPEQLDELFAGENGSRVFAIPSEGLPINTGLPIRERTSISWTRSPKMRALLYTDGYTEAQGGGNELFDEVMGRSLSIFHEAGIDALRAASAEEGIDRLESAWVGFTGGPTGQDDRAAVLVCFD